MRIRALPPDADERDRRRRAGRRRISSCSCCSSTRRCRSCRRRRCDGSARSLAFYGPYLSVALVLPDSRRARRWRRGRSRPAWLSVRLLAWLGAAGAAAAAALTWANLAGFRDGARARRAAERMRQGAVGDDGLRRACSSRSPCCAIRSAAGAAAPTGVVLIVCAGRCRWSCRSGCAGRASCRCRQPRAPQPGASTVGDGRRASGCSCSTARRSDSSASASPPVSCRTSARLHRSRRA